MPSARENKEPSDLMPTDSSAPDFARIRALIISNQDNAGVSRVKVIPGPNVEGAFRNGCGISKSVGVLMAADDYVTHAPGIDAVVGDLRGMPDPSSLALIDEEAGLAWAAADLTGMDGQPFPTCQRTLLKRVSDEWAGAGLEVAVAFELEFTLFDGPRNDPRLANEGPGYGLNPFLQMEKWHLDVLSSLLQAGLPVEQIHPEYGRGQAEISLSPRSPVRAVDDYLLARLIISRVSLRHGLHVSYAPIAHEDTATNGCHIHFSARNSAGNVFFDPESATGISPAGEMMIAGVVHRLVEGTALLGGSPLSMARLLPEHWAGSSICWGTGNREAAVRFVPGLRGREDRQSNVEVKCADGAANHYLAVAAILASALDGMKSGLRLPPEVKVDPSTLTEEERHRSGVRAFPPDVFTALDDLDAGRFFREKLGDELIDAYIAVRRGEAERFAKMDADAVIAALRWQY